VWAHVWDCGFWGLGGEEGVGEGDTGGASLTTFRALCEGCVGKECYADELCVEGKVLL